VNNVSIRDFHSFVKEDSLNEHLLKIPFGKVKKVIINPHGHHYIRDKIVCYVGRDENGTYIKFDDLNWKILIKNHIKNILEIDESGREIHVELERKNERRMTTLDFIISPFSMTKDLKKSLDNSYVFHIKDYDSIG